MGSHMIKLLFLDIEYVISDVKFVFKEKRNAANMNLYLRISPTVRTWTNTQIHNKLTLQVTFKWHIGNIAKTTENLPSWVLGINYNLYFAPVLKHFSPLHCFVAKQGTVQKTIMSTESEA